jgi:transcriptional regulator with XRE-family HTH domain|tara:strand:+ start:3026 stop:3238 length:213 start_codon:yes stop_codon:yes gene_type:complete
MENIKFRIGERIRELRIKKGFSQEKLALLSDLDRTYIPSIESGKRNISITVLERISNALEMTVSEITKEL